MIRTQSAEKQTPSYSGFRFGKMLLVLGVALMISVGSYAQPGDDDLGTDPDLPFDGGVSLLVAAGIAYGAKQWHGNRKKEEKEAEAE